MEVIGGSHDGVCDRITKALFLYTVAKVTRRSAYFSWPSNSRCNCQFEKLFQTTLLTIAGVCRSEGQQIDGTLPSVLHQIEQTRQTPIIQLGDGYRGHNYDDFDAVFSPSEEVDQKRRRFRIDHWRDRMIGVHIRRTDKRRWGGLPGDGEYMAALDALLEQRPHAGIFLASDDVRCQAAFHQRYGERVMSFPVRSFDRGNEDGIIDAVVTLYLLRATELVIGGSYSGYSLCAGWDNGLIDLGSENNYNVDWLGKPIRRPLPPLGPTAARAVESHRSKTYVQKNQSRRIGLECCILFFCHRDNPVTRQHLEILRSVNPYPVVAISRNTVRPVPGSANLQPEDEGLSENGRSSVDMSLYAWFRHRGLDAERYICLEWDTLATLPVREFYEEVWNEPVSAATVMLPENDPHWYWFRQMSRLPDELRQYAAGLVPFCGTLLSHSALCDAVFRKPIPADVFCELRLGTLLRYQGYPLTSLPEIRRRTISYTEKLINVSTSGPAIYHPVKRLVSFEAEMPCATAKLSPAETQVTTIAYPPTFCMKALLINGDHDTARLQSAKIRTSSVGLSFERVAAKIVSDRRQGCLLSHMECVRIAKLREWPEVIIMEDDVIFRDWDLFPKALIQLAEVEWDIFCPYDWYNTDDRRPAKIRVVRTGGTICRHFVMVHSRFYEQFLSHMQTYKGANDRAFINRPHVRQFVTSYNLAGQDGGMSLITGTIKAVRWHA